MKILERLLWIVFGVELVFFMFVMLNHKVSDMTLGNGAVSDYNSGWTVTYSDGTSLCVSSLPYFGESKANEEIILENKLPDSFRGRTLSFLSADKTVRVYVDDELIYDFGSEDYRRVGNTPGSVVNYVTLPDSYREGNIRISMVSPYDNFASYITAIKVGERDVLILKDFKASFLDLMFGVIMVGCGIILLMLAMIQISSKQPGNGIVYFAFVCFLSSIYYTIETKTLSLFYGDQTMYSYLIFLTLMGLPLFYQVYYIKSLPDRYTKGFKILLCASLLNIVVQLSLQLFNVVDLLSMASLSHVLVLLTGLLMIVSVVRAYMDNRDKLFAVEAVGVSAYVICSLIDLIRSYTVKVGDLGAYSRMGLSLFFVVMVFIQIFKIIRSYSLAFEAAENAKLEAIAAANAKSTFLANMSHEIRTPINAVLGMDTMILRESTEPEIIEYANSIQSAGNTLLSLINDILDFSKIESGKMDLVEMEYDMASLINDTYHMLVSKAEDKGLKFIVKTDNGIPALYRGDEVRIRQILVNILNNAIKYTKEGFVEFNVSAKEVKDDTAVLRFEIKDSGIGIAKENLETLFDSFKRLDMEKNRTIEGTGLGMAITKQLVDLMHGEIHVTSEYGVGSTFEVLIPQKVTSDKTLSQMEGRFNRKSVADNKAAFTAPDAAILVVDDVKMNITVFKALLKRVKIKADAAESGAACFEMVTKKKYDIIFLDHMMPGMDGIETFERMKTLEGNINKDTPVIMLTANAIVGAKEQYLEAGFSNYLSKPVQGVELENMIRTYLGEDKILLEEN